MRKVSCPVCGDDFEDGRSESELGRHVFSHLASVRAAGVGSGGFRFCWCGLIIDSAASAVKHFRKHGGVFSHYLESQIGLRPECPR